MNALVVGGGKGIGLALVLELLNSSYKKIYIVGREQPNIDIPSQLVKAFQAKSEFVPANLTICDYSFLDNIHDVGFLMITAGFGRIANFESITETEISNSIAVNELAVMQIIKYYYPSIQSDDDFYCGIMSSIAGHIGSPMFSVYGATKAALSSLILSVNLELTANSKKNRLLDVSPGIINGTSFYGGTTELEQLAPLACEILENIFSRETLFIPKYDDVYRDVLERNEKDPVQFGLESYQYKLDGGRATNRPQTKIGYLSGTFDLFHIGHLNILKRARACCDFLIVGVHRSGAWKSKETYIPFDERVEIVKCIKYVDKVIESLPEDCDVYDQEKYDFLFVGSDYKGTERFNRYEAYFQDKGVKIIYFPYTKSTSSTQLREGIRILSSNE